MINNLWIISLKNYGVQKKLLGKIGKMLFENQFKAILLNKKMLECISSLSGEPTQFHSLFHSLIRMDVPNDEKNILSWHQDFVSSEKVIDHHNGLVSWIPLVSVNSENGSIDICPTSHNDSNAKNMIVKENKDTFELHLKVIARKYYENGKEKKIYNIFNT